MTTPKLCGCGNPIKPSTYWEPHFLCADCEKKDEAERKARLEADRQTFQAYDQEHNEGFCPHCQHPVLFMPSMFGAPLLKCEGCGSHFTQQRWSNLNPTWVNSKEEK